MSDPRRPRPLVFGLAAALGAAAALLVGCGGGGAGSALIPRQDAAQLTTDFDAVARAVENGACGANLRNLVNFTKSHLATLPGTVDPTLKAALQRGVATLSQRAQIECAAPAATTPTTGADTTPGTDTTPATDTSPNTGATAVPSTGTNQTDTTPPASGPPTATEPATGPTGAAPGVLGATQAPTGTLKAGAGSPPVGGSGGAGGPDGSGGAGVGNSGGPK